MTKRFSTFKSTETVTKKSKNTFLPWLEQGTHPISMQNGTTKDGLTYLCKLYTSNGLDLPKIIMKHQLYSIMSNRTIVDRGINQLLQNGEIKVFKTSLGNDQSCVMFTQDYLDHVKVCFSITQSDNLDPSKTLCRFMKDVLPGLKQTYVDENILFSKHGFKDADVTELIKYGVLTVKDAGSWWLSIPHAGNFLKLIRKGRQTVLQMIRRTKYKELNCASVLTRKVPASLKLGIEFHIHDLIGADLVKSVNSTTGLLLKIDD